MVGVHVSQNSREAQILQFFGYLFHSHLLDINKINKSLYLSVNKSLYLSVNVFSTAVLIGDTVNMRKQIL